MINGLITAIRTLTIIPMFGKDTDDFSKSIIWFPFAGFLIGIILFLSIKLSLMLTDYYKFMAALAVFLSAVLTRGIHLDGLADFADGFGGGYTKDKILSIMKDSAIGTFGALALIFVVLFKWIGFLYLIEHNRYSFVIPIYVASRLVMSDLSVRLPYARKGTGTGKPFVENAKKKHLIGAFLIAFALSYFFGILGILSLFFALFLSYVFGLFFKKKIGGVTGDLLGASCEITEIALLILYIFLLPHIGLL